MGPYIMGGDMIKKVTDKDATWNDIPWKFEAGTPNIAGAAGFSAAIDYLNAIGMQRIEKHEEGLTKHAMKRLGGMEIYGPKKRAAIISFNLKSIHPHDVAYLLDKKGIAVRSGHHCAQPLMNLLGIIGTVRASFYLYNTKEEIDSLVDSLKEIKGGL
jgi:cysteine desulfurase/selenocysteine lyase